MRKNQTLSIHDILSEFSKDTKFDQKLMETRVIESWPALLGPTVANCTKSIHIANRTLFVSIESAVMRHELFMLRTRIKDALNKNVNAIVIDNIIFR